MVSRSSLLPRHNQNVMCEGETDRTVDFTSGCHNELNAFLIFNWVLGDIDGCVVAWGEHLRSKVRLKAAGRMGCTDPSSMYITICRHMRNWRLEETSHLLWASSWSSASKGCSEKGMSFFNCFNFFNLFKYLNLNLLLLFIINVWNNYVFFIDVGIQFLNISLCL